MFFTIAKRICQNFQIGANSPWLDSILALGANGRFNGNIERDLHRIFTTPKPQQEVLP